MAIRNKMFNGFQSILNMTNTGLCNGRQLVKCKMYKWQDWNDSASLRTAHSWQGWFIFKLCPPAPVTGFINIFISRGVNISVRSDPGPVWGVSSISRVMIMIGTQKAGLVLLLVSWEVGPLMTDGFNICHGWSLLSVSQVEDVCSGLCTHCTAFSLTELCSDVSVWILLAASLVGTVPVRPDCLLDSY